MGNIQVLRYFRIDGHESVAVMVEQMICLIFILRIVGPIGRGKVVFSGGIGESRFKIVRSRWLSVTGIEFRPHAVPNPKYVSIVHK